MKIIKDIVVNTSIEKAWEVLGTGFSQVHQWASAVNHAETDGEDFNGASCDSRSCDTSLGYLNEKLIQFDPKEYKLGYEIVDGLPFLFAGATNHWTFQKIDQEKTLVRCTAEFEEKYAVVKLLGPIMKIQLSNFLEIAVEDFKYFTETGMPHPRKVKAAQKYQAKHAKQHTLAKV